MCWARGSAHHLFGPHPSGSPFQLVQDDSGSRTNISMSLSEGVSVQWIRFQDTNWTSILGVSPSDGWTGRRGQWDVPGPYSSSCIFSGCRFWLWGNPVPSVRPSVSVSPSPSLVFLPPTPFSLTFSPSLSHSFSLLLSFSFSFPVAAGPD